MRPRWKMGRTLMKNNHYTPLFFYCFWDSTSPFSCFLRLGQTVFVVVVFVVFLSWRESFPVLGLGPVFLPVPCGPFRLSRAPMVPRSLPSVQVWSRTLRSVLSRPYHTWGPVIQVQSSIDMSIRTRTSFRFCPMCSPCLPCFISQTSVRLRFCRWPQDTLFWPTLVTRSPS